MSTCHRSRRRTKVALRAVAAAAVATAVVVAAPNASAAPNEVDTAANALKAASTARLNADRRVVELTTEVARLESQVRSKFGEAAALAKQIESARDAMRRSAIAAYINGPTAERKAIDLLSGSDLAEASGRATFSQSRTLDWADALAHFRAVKRDAGPALVALAGKTEAAKARLAQARDAAQQAHANESDAERNLAAARAAAKAAAAAAAAQAAARATAKAATAVRLVSKPANVAAPAAPRVTIVVQTGLSAPLPDLPPGGPSEAQWAALRRCESGGNYQAVSASGRYRGAYQFDQRTWEGVGGRGDPAAAIPVEQDARAKLLYWRRGARAWPQCGVNLL